MNIRQCPDCKGKGRSWRHPDSRRIIHGFVPDPSVSSTAGYWYEEKLPEWSECELCGGTGKVVCQRLEAKVRSEP